MCPITFNDTVEQPSQDSLEVITEGWIGTEVVTLDTQWRSVSIIGLAFFLWRYTAIDSSSNRPFWTTTSKVLLSRKQFYNLSNIIVTYLTEWRMKDLIYLVNLHPSLIIGFFSFGAPFVSNQMCQWSCQNKENVAVRVAVGEVCQRNYGNSPTRLD